MSLLIVFCFMLLQRDPKASLKPETHTYQVVKLQNLYVLQDDDKFTYTFQAEDDSNEPTLHIRKGQTLHGTFCPDYEPMFSTGQTLNWLQYEDRHECWSLFDQHPKYLIRRNHDGSPNYAGKETANADRSNSPTYASTR